MSDKIQVKETSKEYELDKAKEKLDNAAGEVVKETE